MHYRETIMISWTLSLILWLDGTTKWSTLGIKLAYFACRREGSKNLLPRGWSMVNYIVLLFKILGAPSGVKIINPCPLTPGFAIWFPLVKKYEKPDIPLPGRIFKSYCLILLHSSFLITMRLAMFQVGAALSAWVPEWRQPQTERQLTNVRNVTKTRK